MQLPVMAPPLLAQLEDPGALPAAPMLPGPASPAPAAPSLPPPRAVVPKLQFERSLEDLMNQGAISPSERKHLEQGGSPLRELCRTGVMSLRECSRVLALQGIGGLPISDFAVSESLVKGDAPRPRGS